MARVGDSSCSPRGQGDSCHHSSPRSVESYFSTNSSICSVSSLSSSSSSASTLTPTCPVSASSDNDSVGNSNSSTPLWKTLVRPRAWRFVHRSRLGGSLDRERARQEDTSLESMEDNTDAREKLRSSMEIEELASDACNARNGDQINREASQKDSVSKTKSELDIAVRRTVSCRGPAPEITFKSRAQRFSLKDDSSNTSASGGISGSHTLPHPRTYRMAETSQTQNALHQSAVVKFSSLRRSRSSGGTLNGPKTVKFSEPEKEEITPASVEGSPDELDSPSRNVNLNVHDTSMRVSFSKPATPAKMIIPENPVIAADRVTSRTQKPEIPAKPARLSSSSLQESTLNERTNGGTKPCPAIKSSSTSTYNSALPKSQVNSVVLTSPTIPDHDLLFSTGCPISDEECVSDVQSKLVAKDSQLQSSMLPTNDLSDKTARTASPSNTPERENNKNTSGTSSQTLDRAEEEAVTQVLDNPLVAVCVSELNASQISDSPGKTDKTAHRGKKHSKVKDKETIVPKKMVKIKGDKKADEKAAKAKKKEEKARDKELKSKKKSGHTNSDSAGSGQAEKGRVKLFPWKVEFSARDKSPSANTSASLLSSKTEDKQKVKDGKKGKVQGKGATIPVGVEETEGAIGVPGGERCNAGMVGLQSMTAAPSKKTDKDDGATSGNNNSNDSNKVAHDRADLPPHAPPSTEEEHHLHQQHQHQHLQPATHDPLQRRAVSPSPTPSQPLPLPNHLQQQQQLQLHHQYHAQRQPASRPRYFDELSSSDQNSDRDSVYGSLPRRHQGPRPTRVCESDGEGTAGPSQHGASQGRRLTPRRHTVGGAQIMEHLQLVEETDRKREAFYEMLADRYPQYADKITGFGHYPPVPTASGRASRPREPQRRRTTHAMAPYSSRSQDYDDPGTMSDIEVPSFQRGGVGRASLPIVRSASTSLERPIGLVFLVYHDETKKAVLPNEITSLDTVRALFVRAFPEKLSMEFLDSPKRKIYILESSTSIFFQLEDLRDIHDRTVLKIHECDSMEPQIVKNQPEIRGRNTQSARPSSRQGFIGETGSDFRDEMANAQSMPMSTGQNFQDVLLKERAQWEMEQEYLQMQQRRSRSRSQTPEPAERPRSLSTGAPRTRYSHSPDRLVAQDRGPPHLNPIPENPRMLANGFRQAAVDGGHYDGNHPHMPHPTGSHKHLPPTGRVVSPAPVGQPVYDSVYQHNQGYHNPQAFVSHSMRASTPQGPLRATGLPPDMRGSARGGPSQRPSHTFAAASNPVYESFPQQRTQPYRVTPERDVLPSKPQSSTPHGMGRMERMEAQIASLAAWVHQVQRPPADPPARRGSSRSTSSAFSEGTDTYPGSNASTITSWGSPRLAAQMRQQMEQNGECRFSPPPGLSDIPAVYSVRQPVVTMDMREKINDMHCRMRELRVELQGLRRMEQLNQEAMRDAFTETLSKLKKVIGAVPGAENQVIRQQRMEVNALAEAYMQDKAKVENELSDLETSVEELKEGVISKKCRVNITDIEGLALELSNITKSLADLKARFPQVNDSLKNVMSGEMEIVVKEEKFVREEPQHIESALKRCKQLTSTLYTLKRLATVQDTQQPQVPALALESKEVGDEEKMAVLESIRTMVPDHASRVQSLEAADASRERKKKIVAQQESLKFTKSLQTASKSLKPTETHVNSGKNVNTGKNKGETVSSKDLRRPGSAKDVLDSKRPDHPVVPAKPARLMLSPNQGKPGDTAKPNFSPISSASAPVSAVSHTVTVTSQISDDVAMKKTETVQDQRSSARSAFFSSMQPPPSSKSSKIGAIASLGAVSISSATVPSSPSLSHSKPAPAINYQAGSPTRTQSTVSNIPSCRRLSDGDISSDKLKKVPPPPPPRKSSAKFPFGVGPLSPESPNDAGRMPGGRHSSDKVPDGGHSPVLCGYKATSPGYAGFSAPQSSSTPKPVTSQKPIINKPQMASVPAEQKPEIRRKRSTPEKAFITFIPPVPADVVTNSQDPIDEGDLSGSESTGSTTSLDSQQGIALIRANSCPSHRGPKPYSPHKHSSTNSKGSGSDDKVKSQHVNGHKT